jgi:TIGR03009 family protein
MRHVGLAVGLMLIGTASVQAQTNQQGQQPPRNQPAQQQPQQQPAPALPTNPRLDSLLDQWEAKMTSIKSIEAQIARQYDDKTWKTKEVYTGKAYFQAPNLARLELGRQDNPALNYERYVCTGQFTYQFVPAQKQLRVYDMGPIQKGGGAQGNFLSFLVGMKAAEAKQRYNIALLGEDKWYIYLEVMPRYAADKADFTTAKIALRQQEFTPAMLVYTEANGNVATWNIPKLVADSRLDRRLFEKPDTPPGWELKREPAPGARAAGATPASASGGQPRIMRQNGQ